ncbi:MAG: C10 family peptidase [Treponema sp.]|nr:C10 family peptidase [Treponema sp.]
MNTKKILFVTVIIATMLILSCDNIFSKPESQGKLENNHLTREEEIALMHLEEDYSGFIKSPDELTGLVQERLDSATRSEHYQQLVISKTESFSKTFERGFKTQKGEIRTSEVRFYLYTLIDPEAEEGQQPGFALMCDDVRIGNFIAMMPQGDWNDPDNSFLVMYRASLDGYIQKTIDTFNHTAEADIKAAQEKLTQLEQNARFVLYWDHGKHTSFGGNLINTRWNGVGKGTTGGVPYNWAVDYNVNPNPIPNQSATPLLPQYAVGCDVVALAQLVAYHEWFINNNGDNAPYSSIKSPHPYGTIQNDRTYFYYPHTGLYTTTPEQQYFADIDYFDWAGMKADVIASNIHLDFKLQVTTLIFQIGCLMGKEFGSEGGSLTPIELVLNALWELGYASFGIQSSTNGDNFLTATGIMRSLNEKKPVYASGVPSHSGMGTVATAWLMDGYKIVMAGYARTILVHCILENGYDGEFNFGIFGNDIYDMKYITGVYPPAK